MTNNDLSNLIRLSYDRKTSMFLWVMAELAVICADTQEVIGSAVGLRLLTGMPIIMGVIATIIISLVYLNDPGDPSFTEVRPKNH
jgi:NRAMP (natural resistance-associated macrophage protein)-like metal ion transporter